MIWKWECFGLKIKYQTNNDKARNKVYRIYINKYIEYIE